MEYESLIHYLSRQNFDRYADLCLQWAYVYRMDHNSCRIFKGVLGGFKISQNIIVMNPKNLEITEDFTIHVEHFS